MINARVLTNLYNECKPSNTGYNKFKDVGVMELVEFVIDNIDIVRLMYDKTTYKLTALLVDELEYGDFAYYDKDSVQQMVFELMAAIVYDIETYIGEELKTELQQTTKMNILESYVLKDHNELSEAECDYYTNDNNFNLDGDGELIYYIDLIQKKCLGF